MATHSSGLAWRIPGMGEPGGGAAVSGVQQQQVSRIQAFTELLPQTILVPYSEP